MEKSLKAHTKMTRQMATESRPILMEASLNANTKMARQLATERMTYPDGRFFEGEFKDDKRDGHGKETYAKGKCL